MGFSRFSAWKHVGSFHLFSSWDVWRWRITRTVWHTSKKKKWGKAIHLPVWELSEYLKQHSRGEWPQLPALEPKQQFRLHSAVKPVQRKKQLRSAEDGNSRCVMHCETISSPKPVIYNICQNCSTISIYRARAKQKEKKKGKRLFACTMNWSPDKESIGGAKGKRIFRPFEGGSTQMLTCALSLLRYRKIYEKNIECLRRLLVVPAILYVPHESRDGGGALYLQHLRVCEACAYVD